MKDSRLILFRFSEGRKSHRFVSGRTLHPHKHKGGISIFWKSYRSNSGHSNFIANRALATLLTIVVQPAAVDLAKVCICMQAYTCTLTHMYLHVYIYMCHEKWKSWRTEIAAQEPSIFVDAFPTSRGLLPFR